MTVLYALRLRWSYAAGIPVCLWFFSTYLQLETLLMEEAQRLWALEHGG